MDTQPYPIPANEEQRLRVLAEYDLLDTPETEDFDRLVNLAAHLFDVPIVLISLVDKNRQFFKARVGVDICETSREISFCAHAILQDDILFVPDALLDSRFSSNPAVLGPPFVRFYAGKPLIAPTGERLGTICLVDSKPRTVFSEEDRHHLFNVAALIMDRMEMYRLHHLRSVNHARFENIAAISSDAIVCSDAEGDITFWNRSAEKLFGYSSSELGYKSAVAIVADRCRQLYDAELERLQHDARTAETEHALELIALRKDGTEFPAEFSLSVWEKGEIARVVAVVRDITERRKNEEHLFRRPRSIL